MANSRNYDMKVYGGIKLYAGTGSPELAQRVAEYIGEPLCGRDIIQFPNDWREFFKYIIRIDIPIWFPVFKTKKEILVFNSIKFFPRIEFLTIKRLFFCLSVY